MKIIRPNEWGLDPNRSRQLSLRSNTHNFNYWDYQHAWNEAFYYQNPKHKHTWFFHFNKKIIEQILPNWIFQWWDTFDPSLDILPEAIKVKYLPWLQFHPKSKDIQKYAGQSSFYYFAEFSIPWIWRWNIEYVVNSLKIPILARTFHTRWWQAYPIDDKAKEIQSCIEDYAKASKKLAITPAPAPNPFDALKATIRQQYPMLNEKELMIKCMEAMKEQFFSTFTSTDSPDNMSITSDTSGDHQNQFTCLAGESQDPADDEPTFGDIWDAMIQLASTSNKAEPSKANKGKEQV